MDNAIIFSQAGSVLTVGAKEETLDDDRAILIELADINII